MVVHCIYFIWCVHVYVHLKLQGLYSTCIQYFLLELLVKDLNLLEKHSLISMEDGFVLQPTGIMYSGLPSAHCYLLLLHSHLPDTGRLMARYCVAFKSMQRFLGLHGREGLEELVGMVSQCQEFSDVHLRMSEKRVLNTLNKDKNRATIR